MHFDGTSIRHILSPRKIAAETGDVFVSSSFLNSVLHTQSAGTDRKWTNLEFHSGRQLSSVKQHLPTRTHLTPAHSLYIYIYGSIYAEAKLAHASIFYI